MFKFTKDILRYLEKLSCIQCSTEEEEELTQSLQKILEYVEQLGEIDTENVPTFWSNDQKTPRQPLRKDTIDNLLLKEPYLDNVESTAGMIRVPPVLTDKGTSS